MMNRISLIFKFIVNENIYFKILSRLNFELLSLNFIKNVYKLTIFFKSKNYF
jgi:hypothetical protein